MTTTVQRIHNFSAGPAVLPVSVLEEAQRDLVSLPGVGMSILEISHRSKTFEDILAETEAILRTLGNIPATHKVLFLQGGASLQFSMVPMNLLAHGHVPPTTSSPAAGRRRRSRKRSASARSTLRPRPNRENFAGLPRRTS